MSREYEDDDPLPGQEEDHTFVTTYEPRKHRSTLLPPGAVECIKNELNWVEKYLNLTRTAQTDHAFEDDFAETIKEQQARWVIETQFTPSAPPMTVGTQEQKLEQLMDTSPLAKIANLKEENRQRRIKTHLDTIERGLTLPKDKITKECQARYTTEMQYKLWAPSPLSQVTTNDDMTPKIQTLIMPPHIDKACRMLAENKQRCLEAHVSHLEEQIKQTTDAHEHVEYPTPPTTPPQTSPEQIDELVHQLDIN